MVMYKRTEAELKEICTPYHKGFDLRINKEAWLFREKIFGFKIENGKSNGESSLKGAGPAEWSYQHRIFDECIDWYQKQMREDTYISGKEPDSSTSTHSEHSVEPAGVTDTTATIDT